MKIPSSRSPANASRLWITLIDMPGLQGTGAADRGSPETEAPELRMHEPEVHDLG